MVPSPAIPEFPFEPPVQETGELLNYFRVESILAASRHEEILKAISELHIDPLTPRMAPGSEKYDARAGRSVEQSRGKSSHAKNPNPNRTTGQLLISSESDSPYASSNKFSPDAKIDFEVTPKQSSVDTDPVEDSQTRRDALASSISPFVQPGRKTGRKTFLANLMKLNAQESQLHVSNKGIVRVSRKKTLGELKDKGWRHLLRHLVKQSAFEYIFAAVIFANALTICFEVQYEGFLIGSNMRYARYETDKSKIWPNADTTFNVLDWTFGTLLFMETCTRFLGLGWDYFWDGWNYLDVICVIAFFFDKLLSSVVSINKNIVHLMRLFRLIRLIKLLRTLDGLDVLYLITTALGGLGSILGWAIALLGTLLISCSLLLSQMLHIFYFEGLTYDGGTSEELALQARVYEYFGTFTRCLFSLFELTLANYPPAARLLSEEVSEWFFLICLLHKLTIGLAVIGVINGVIMQETFKVAASDNLIMLRQKKRAATMLRAKMNGLFQALDQNGDGSIDFDEFEIIAERPDVKYWLASLEIETDDLRTLFVLADADDSGTITIEELTARIPRLQGTARSIDLLALQKQMKDETKGVKAIIRKESLSSLEFVKRHSRFASSEPDRVSDNMFHSPDLVPFKRI